MNKITNIKRLFTGNYSLDTKTLNNYNISLNDVLDCVNVFMQESNYSDAIKVLRKAETIWPNNYTMSIKLILCYINLNDFESAHEEMLRADNMGVKHSKTTYYLIRVLKTYHNILKNNKIPNVYEMGNSFMDAYKKWDLVGAQMFSVDEKYTHKVLEEINRIVVDRRLNVSTYYDTFDSIVSKIYYEPKSMDTRNDLAVYLYENGLFKYQDLFMWLLYKQDEYIYDYLDTVTRNMKLNTNEMMYELKTAIENKDVKMVRKMENILYLLPETIYPEVDKRFVKYIVNRFDYLNSNTFYNEANKDNRFETEIKSNRKKEKQYIEPNPYVADKIEYILDVNHIPYEYEIIDNKHVFTLNKKEVEENEVEKIDDSITWNINNIYNVIDKTVYKCTPIKRAVQKLPKNQKLKATLMSAREAFNVGKYELATSILNYANELMRESSVSKEETELRNIIQERIKKLTK